MPKLFSTDARMFVLSAVECTIARQFENRIMMSRRRLTLVVLSFCFVYIFVEFRFAFTRKKWKNYYSKTITRPITTRRRNSSLNIGIVVVLDSKERRAEYRQALDSLNCYTRFFNYPLEIIHIDQNTTFSTLCPHRDFMFRRHCVAALVLPKYDWLLFVDGDVGVINPEHLLEHWVDDRVHLIFYDRLFNFEIMAGSYLVRNTPYAIEFLNFWADYEFKVPHSHHGTDNGAIQMVFLDKLVPSATEGKRLCQSIWNQSIEYADLYVFEACCRAVLGANRLWPGRVKILDKGTGWARDGWLTESLWAPRDFMFHGWQNRRQDSFQFASWPNPLSADMNLSRCAEDGRGWHWKDSFIKSDVYIEQVLTGLSKQARRQFWDTTASVAQFIR